LLADQAPAQEPATIPATVTNSSEIMTPAPRVGLFGRLRERRGMTTTVNQPIVQAQAIEPQPVVQAQAIQPQPIAAQQTPSGVQQAQYSEKVAMPATPAMSATAMPATAMPAQMQVVETRQGLLARLRARRGQ
jgi:hypothetical protein